MAEEKTPRYPRTEDLGESIEKMGANTASPGAGARASQERTNEATEPPYEHTRVEAGGDEQGIPPAKAPREIMRSQEEKPTQEQVSDEEFTRSVEELHEERTRKSA